MADVHYDAPNMHTNIMWALRSVEQYALDNDISDIIILGDLFHNRRAIVLDCLSNMHTLLASWKEKGIRVILFPGNHDMFYRHNWDVTSLDTLVDVAVVFKTVSLFKLDGRRFWVLPFIQDERVYMNALTLISSKHEEGDVLLTHIGTMNATLNKCFLVQNWNIVTFDPTPFDTVYTGHFHLQQSVGRNVYYPGSLLPMKFDEGDAVHGFYVLNTDDMTHEFVDVIELGKTIFPKEPIPPNYTTILGEMVDKIDRDIIANNYVRVIVPDASNKPIMSSIRNKLLDIGAARVVFMEVASDDQEVRLGAIQDVVCFDELMATWIRHDTKIDSALDESTLLRYDHEIRYTGDTNYINQS